MTHEFPKIQTVIEQGMDRGLHLGCQLCVLHAGKTVIDLAVGEARPGEPLTPQHAMMWLSGGKPLTVVLLAQLWEQGKLDLDDPVARFLPEFAVHGKQGITLRHILIHTAGLRQVDTGWPEVSWDETIQRICAATPDPDSLPGQTPGYHPLSTWFLLGEILQRVEDRPYLEILQTGLLDPLGMPHTSAVSEPTSPGQQPVELAPLYERQQGTLVEIPWSQAPRASRLSPGSSLRGPVRDLAIFYETLRKPPAHLSNNRSQPVLQRPTIAALTARHRVGEFDQTLMHAVDFGLGMIINSRRYGVDTVPYGYGRYASERTFGHGGAQCTQGYCDPENELVVAYAFNGRPGEGQHQRRVRALNDAIYEELGLATD